MYGKHVYARIFVDAGVTFATVEGACQLGREFADQAVVGEAEIAQFEREADEVCEEVRGMDAAIDEDGAIDVGVRDGREG